MATLRELKGRIGSVASSEKITGAMKMISSAKMHKAELALRRLRPYRDCIRQIIANLVSTDAPVLSPLTETRRDVSHVTILILGSDDGLCGAYNVNLYKALLQHLSSLRALYGDDTRFEVVPVGRKMFKAAAKISADPRIALNGDCGLDSKADGAKVKGLLEDFISRFTSGRTDRIDLLFMNFISAGRQRPRASQLLPISPEALAEGAPAATGRPCLFEPDAASIFDTALPMYLLADLNDAFAENRASEQAARVMAMQSSNDNAKKLLEQLRIEYNKLRQQSITNELLDIVGGQAHD